MKKKLAFIILSLTLLFCIFTSTGCVPTNEYGHEVYEVTDKVTLIKVVNTDYFDIFVHKETRVMYIKYADGGIAVMLDKEGKPLIWSKNL